MAPELNMTTEEAGKLFDKLDDNGNGFIEQKEEIQSILNTIPGRIGLLCE